MWSKQLRKKEATCVRLSQKLPMKLLFSWDSKRLIRMVALLKPNLWVKEFYPHYIGGFKSRWPPPHRFYTACSNLSSQNWSILPSMRLVGRLVLMSVRTAVRLRLMNGSRKVREVFVGWYGMESWPTMFSAGKRKRRGCCRDSASWARLDLLQPCSRNTHTAWWSPSLALNLQRFIRFPSLC